MTVIVREGPGFVVERSDEGDTLVSVGSWSAEAGDLLDTGQVEGLDLNYAKGFKDTDLAFLRPWPIRRLSVLSRTSNDVSPIYRLSETLETLSIQCASSVQVDLRNLPCLQSLSAGWAQVSSSIGDALGLRDLYLGSYGERDLSPLRWNTQLERLRLKDRPRTQTLDGIEFLPRIEHLGVFGAPIEDIGPLGRLERLSELHLQSCRVRDLGPIAKLSGLRVLNMSEGGEIDSVSSIESTQRLEMLWLFGTTRVVDDDLGPIARLPRLRDLRMKARRSYRPSVDLIQAQIEARKPG